MNLPIDPAASNTKRATKCSLQHPSLGAALLCLLLLSGCASLLPKPAAQQTLFALSPFDVATNANANATASATTNATAPATPRAQPSTAAPTLIVNATRAAAGFDSASIVYMRRSNEIEYFNASRWVDTPAQMLGIPIARAIEGTGAFNAVVRTPSSATGELRLDTELVRLQHDFTQAPSRVRLTLHAVMIDTATRRVVASRDFNATVISGSEDAAGGVVAANSAVSTVLVELAAFCAENARR